MCDLLLAQPGISLSSINSTAGPSSCFGTFIRVKYGDNKTLCFLLCSCFQSCFFEFFSTGKIENFFKKFEHLL